MYFSYKNVNKINIAIQSKLLILLSLFGISFKGRGMKMAKMLRERGAGWLKGVSF